MEGTRKAINRILQAIQNKEKIILFGDGDLDGVVSVVIMKEALEILGHSPFSIFFANRIKYGYGLSEKILKAVKIKGPGLLIVMDCGTSNIRGIQKAVDMGFEVIVIDHHQPSNVLPKAIIINPHQEKQESLAKIFCAGGLTYEFTKQLLFEAQKEFNPEQFLEMAMLATIYDQVPLEGKNQEIIDQGLFSLPQTQRIGLKALLEATDCQVFDYTEVQGKLIPALAAGLYKNYQDEAFLLLVEQNPGKAIKIAEVLLKRREEKKERIIAIIEEIQESADTSLPIIFSGSKDWPLPLLGIVASKLCGYFLKPAFIYSQARGVSQGSVRTPKEIDSIDMMKPCADLLINYGGHPQASGFGLKNKDIAKFKKCLIENYKLIF